MRHSLLSRLFLLVVLLAATVPSHPAMAAQQAIYTDDLAQSWNNWSWASVNLGATSPVHSGSRSIAVTYGAWQGLYLAYAGFSTGGFTRLRFWIHGGSAGGQRLQVYAIRASDPDGQHGPTVAVTPPAANTWREVSIPLADLGAANTAINGLVWQGATGGGQPVLYVDDIDLVDDSSPDGPALSQAVLGRFAAPADGATTVVVRAKVSDPQGASDIAGVTLDVGALGRGSLALRDDGRSNDGAARDGVYGALFSVAPGTATGEYQLLLAARDKDGHQATAQIGHFAVLAPPGGAIPSGLPQRIGWGTNEWNETDANDWQVQSGVPWDFAYQYITWGWEGWGQAFVSRFVNQAWRKGYIPVVSVYLILGTPPACGESATCYVNKLKDPAAAANYLSSLQRAAIQARGDKPVIFQIDPDFYGFMQQLSNDPANRPAGVKPDDPGSFPVALNVPGYANTLAGFGKRIVDVVHGAAPNVLVAPHASMWATNKDPNNVPASEVVQLAQRTAAFISAMGGDKADLLFIEWSDRDAGSALRPWWDDTNRALPRYSRASLWQNALSAAAGKRLILWQVPCGNMALDNTKNRYQDNRVAYAFDHSRDLFDAGVAAVLFGGGNGEMTQPSTDGGYIKAQGKIAYDAPDAPGGLTAAALGPTAQLRWDESSEPDLWGYRVSYRPVTGMQATAVTTVDVRGANSASILLPSAGTWQLSVADYDAMGHVGPASSEVSVTTEVNARQTHLPFVRR